MVYMQKQVHILAVWVLQCREKNTSLNTAMLNRMNQHKNKEEYICVIIKGMNGAHTMEISYLLGGESEGGRG